MANYRGPHVAVLQKFDTSAPGVALEDLPSIAIGTSYEVYDRSVMSSFVGVNTSTKFPFSLITDSTPIYDGALPERRDYTFYPTVSYVDTVFGDIKLDRAITSEGVEIQKDDTYTVPGTKFSIDNCNARIPFYTQDTAVTVNSSGSSLTVSGGYLRSAKLVQSQRVFLKTTQGAVEKYVYVGSVSSEPTSENVINISRKVAAGSYTGIIVGCELEESVTTSSATYVITSHVATFTVSGMDDYTVIGDAVYVDGEFFGFVTDVQSGILEVATVKTDVSTPVNIVDGKFVFTKQPSGKPNTLYDSNADFMRNNVAIGDLVSADTTSGAVKSSIVNIVNRNTVFFNTLSADNTKYSRAYTSSTLATSTSNVKKYSIERLIGFSEVSTPEEPLVKTADTDTTEIELKTTVLGAVKEGDLIAFYTGAAPAAYTDVILAVSPGATHTTITVEKPVTVSTTTKIATWRPKVTNDIKISFRAINKASHLKDVRIQSVNDITDNFGEITPFNELSFMLNTMFALSGYKVCYGINVDSSAGSISAEYNAAFDKASTLEVYSHAIGTTRLSPNVIAAYVNASSDPYEAHERIAICSYDMLDLVYYGSGNVTDFNGSTLTLSGVDLSYETKMGDIIKLTDNTNYGEYEVVTTPSNSSTVDVRHVDGYEFSSTVQPTEFSIYVGNPSDQADKIAQVRLGERRVTSLIPGWFEAEYNGETQEFPPYFMASAIAGLDCGKIVSQSLTYMNISIPDLSNYRLGTTSYFSKNDLDTIGGAGYDIMIQRAPVTQQFFSRHDLTTNMDAIEYRERSITKQVDVVAKTYRTAIDPYIGKYNITDQLLDFIKHVCVNVNKSLRTGSIIKDIEIQSITRDKDIKDKINIIVSVTVFVAGNYYEITLNVKS